MKVTVYTYDDEVPFTMEDADSASLFPTDTPVMLKVIKGTKSWVWPISTLIRVEAEE